MNRIAASLAVLTLASLGAGCASGPRAVLRGGMWPSSYTPPVGHNQIADKEFVVTINRINNGGMATNFFAEITVRNVGGSAALFDPADIELLVPETGMTYQHITKDKSSVTVPLGFNLMSATRIKPGQMIAGSLWFQTPPYKAEAKTVQLSYHEQQLNFPPDALGEDDDDRPRRRARLKKDD
jgi:hypothetical protein